MKRDAGRPGYTLVELLVVLPLIVMGSILLIWITYQGWRAYLFAAAQSKANYETTRLLDRMSRVLRSTTRIYEVKNNEIVFESFYSPRDVVPDKSRYYIDGTRLKIDTIPATGTAPNYTYDELTKKTYDLGEIRNGGSNLFRYYDENNQSLTDLTDVAAVKQIEIVLITNPYPEVLPKDQEGSTKVQLRNLKTNL